VYTSILFYFFNNTILSRCFVSVAPAITG